MVSCLVVELVIGVRVLVVLLESLEAVADVGTHLLETGWYVAWFGLCRCSWWWCYCFVSMAMVAIAEALFWA